MKFVSSMLGMLGVTMMMSGAWLLGCAEEATEPSESSTSELKPSCVSEIDAPVGSKAWRAALDACIAETTAQASKGSGTPSTSPPSPAPAPAPQPAPTPPTGGNQSCQTGIQCSNGACICTDGPVAGKSCDGTTKTGTKSCSVMCKVCN